MMHLPKETKLFRNEAWLIFKDGLTIIALKASRWTKRYDIIVSGRRIGSVRRRGRSLSHMFNFGRYKLELYVNSENLCLMRANLYIDGVFQSCERVSTRWKNIDTKVSSA